MAACLKRLEESEAAKLFMLQVSTFQTFCNCLATLLQMKSVETDVAAVQYFAMYKGTGIFEKAIHSILTKDVDGPSRRVKAIAESRDLIHKMYKDVVRTAASAKVQQPLFDTILESLQQESCAMSVLQDAWEKLPSFKTGLREGACKPMEDCLLQVAKNKGDMILEETPKGSTPKLSSKDLNILLCVLKEFPKEAGIIDLQTKLLKWAKNHNDTLAQTELEQLLGNFIEFNCQNFGKRGKFISMDVNLVKEAVQKCRNKIPTALEPHVHGAVFLYLKAAEDHVPLTQAFVTFGFHCWPNDSINIYNI